MRRSLLQCEIIITKPLFSIEFFKILWEKKNKNLPHPLGLWVMPKLMLLMQNNKNIYRYWLQCRFRSKLKSKSDKKWKNKKIIFWTMLQQMAMWLCYSSIHFLQNSLFLLKSVRANLMYLEKWQFTEYWKNRPNNLDFLPIQNFRQYHFHDVAKYEKISPKESVDIKEFMAKWGIYLPVIRRDVAMVTALIQKLTTKNKPYFNIIHSSKSLQGNL